MKAAELFVRCLENEGVDTIFGLPGEENIDVMDALLDSGMRFILTRHEQGAAFMADVHGRLTGSAGVCLATLGPGACNLVTGVADANMDRAPLVAIAGQAATMLRMHKESHQHIDLVQLFDPISKYSGSDPGAGDHSRGRAQGLQAGRRPRSPAPASSSCPRTWPRPMLQEPSRAAHCAVQAAMPSPTRRRAR